MFGRRLRQDVFPVEGWEHSEGVSEGSASVSSLHGNPIGAMHGGAQVMLATEVAAQG